MDLSTSLPPLVLLTPPFKNEKPIKKIFTEIDITNWLNSEAYNYLGLMINRLSFSVESKSIQDICHESETVKSLVKFLDNTASWIDTIPLQTSPQRFGNKSFRDWISMLEENERDFQLEIVPLELQGILPELSHHFRTAFGSGPRLDYGTGHELSFLAYLTILRLVGIFKVEDEQALVTRVFVAYLGVVRKLQKVYRLEPAGSKGVWGLDDHQHLVYLWGAAQLRTHPTLRPSSILSPPSIAPHSMSYLFLSSILHITALKSGPFAEHSPMLHNIASTVPNWSKVNSGLLKMYNEEVLKKVPVVQHFWFGDILAWRNKDTGEEMISTGDGKEGEVEEEEATRQTFEGTVAPWNITSEGIKSPPPPPSTTTTSTTSSTSASTSSTMPDTRVPWATTSLSTSLNTLPFDRQTFQPPTLFPSRNQSRTTVADSGGAAASSSLFGVLSAPTLGGVSSSESRGTGVPWKEEK